jgi:hypothetical protein
MEPLAWGLRGRYHHYQGFVDQAEALAGLPAKWQHPQYDYTGCGHCSSDAQCWHYAGKQPPSEALMPPETLPA